LIPAQEAITGPGVMLATAVGMLVAAAVAVLVAAGEIGVEMTIVFELGVDVPGLTGAEPPPPPPQATTAPKPIANRANP
jgi:hypothetical protein